MTIYQGSIVWATIPDQAGKNHKDRPALIVTPTQDIVQATHISAVAITTSFGRSPSDQEVPLPWDAQGKSRTRLRQACVAMCNWRVEIEKAQIRKWKALHRPRLSPPSWSGLSSPLPSPFCLLPSAFCLPFDLPPPPT